MTTIHDVAAYVANQTGPLSAMKLQKLVYYAQAWHMVWREEPLFNEDFQAWANGPVAPDLYKAHQGLFKVDASTFGKGNPTNISEESRQAIDKVVGFYGQHSAQWLSNLTHSEAPWKDARGDSAPGERSTEVVAKNAIYEYYDGL